jgi:hypothetical protein
MTPTPGTASAGNQYQTTFDMAYYASRPPEFQPFYWGRPGIPTPEGQTSMTSAQFIALVKQMLQSPPINPDTKLPCYMIEQIEVWGWDPLTAMLDAINNGDGHFPPAGGFAQGSDAPGVAANAGPLAPGAPGTNVSTALHALWPVSAVVPPPTVSDQVGPLIFGPYYEVLGTNPPAVETDYRGTFKLGSIMSAFMMDDGVPMAAYILQPATAGAVSVAP